MLSPGQIEHASGYDVTQVCVVGDLFSLMRGTVAADRVCLLSLVVGGSLVWVMISLRTGQKVVPNDEAFGGRRCLECRLRFANKRDGSGVVGAWVRQSQNVMHPRVAVHICRTLGK